MNTRFTNTDEKKSMTEIIYISSGGTVIWILKKQMLSTLSTMEEEYVTFTHIGTEACWFHNLYTKLEFPLQSAATIWEDNLGAVLMANNPFITQKSRHIDLKHHSIQQLISQ
jgi:hypothetical protein